jgi:hypothetical protein
VKLSNPFGAIIFDYRNECRIFDSSFGVIQMNLSDRIEEIKKEEESAIRSSRKNLIGGIVSLFYTSHSFFYGLPQEIFSLPDEKERLYLIFSLMFIALADRFYKNSEFWENHSQNLRQKYPAYFQDDENGKNQTFLN